MCESLHLHSVLEEVPADTSQQGLLARRLGEGHRVIHGVAGSGKTMILGYRCLYLAETLSTPVLVLCFNVTLAARLREMMAERGVGDRVNIYSFHAWCKAQLRTYHVTTPEGEAPIWERQVAAVIEGVASGVIPRAQYGAVLIDEGHDFEPDWLRLVTGMVDPDTDALLLLYDDAQSIYAKRPALDFSLSSVGIQARGRTTILRLNYRNTEEILNFAYAFVQHYLGETVTETDRVPIIQPESAGRHGASPAVRMFEGFPEECRYVARVFRHLHDEKDVPWSDMCIVYHGHWMAEHLAAAFKAAGIATQVLGDSTQRRNFAQNSETVKLMTMHSSKGLEFPVVAVAGVGYLAKDETRRVSDAKLLYVAMTRSTDRLLLTSCRKNEFTQQLLAIAA
jgi:superfamily I DNA/RNA helicase